MLHVGFWKTWGGYSAACYVSLRVCSCSCGWFEWFESINSRDILEFCMIFWWDFDDVFPVVILLNSAKAYQYMTLSLYTVTHVYIYIHISSYWYFMIVNHPCHLHHVLHKFNFWESGIAVMVTRYVSHFCDFHPLAVTTSTEMMGWRSFPAKKQWYTSQKLTAGTPIITGLYS